MQRKCLGLPEMFAKAIMSLLVTLCIAATAHAQSVNVTGTVVDEGGESLIGVNILVKGTDSGTVTDFDGKYSLSVDRGATMVFSYTGFTTQEITVGNNAVINVTLLTDAELLGEVVVIGYGQTQNKRATTTAVSTINSGQIEELRTARPETALQGSAPGVIVAQTSGSPGAPLTVRMRGVGSPNASAPLYLVNGIQVPNLEYLNANDIQSISLLKDAASAAIYGSRGGNGVVLVQTKQGRRNSDKPSIQFDSYYGVQNLAYKPELMNKNEYIDYYNNAVANFEMPTGFRGVFTDSERNALPDTDWYDAIFNKNAPTSNIHLSFADGGEKFDYSLGGGIFNQDGMVAGDIGKSDYQRRNVRGTINADLAKNLQLSVNADYTNLTRNFLIENSGGTGTALMNYITAIPAIYPTHAENGEIFNMGRQNPNPEYNGVPLNVLGAVTNPLWSIEISNNDAVQNVLLLSGSLSYQPVENLNIRGSYSFYKLDALNRSFTPLLNYPEQTFTTNGFVSYSETTNKVQNSQYNLTAEYTFDDLLGGDHGFKVLGGFEVIESYSNLGGNVFNAGSYLVNDFESVNFALATDISTALVNPGVEAETGLLSYFGRINYDYKDKYLVSLSLRNDQSSNFGANNRSGIFPAVSVGWLLSEESFFNVKAIDLFKVRASWGVNGSDAAAPYSYVATVTTSAQYAGNPGITLTGLANPDLKWEELTQTNIGLDINMFNSALGLTVDYYNKNTADILLRANTPLSTGLNPSFVNVGTVNNQGVEVLLSYRNRVNEDFKWNASIGMGYNKNEVTSLGDNGQALEGGFTGQLYADPITLTALNQPISSFYGYVVEGVDARGNLLFADLDKSGNDQTQPNDGDKAFIGNPLPDYTFGLNLGAIYKGFDLNAYFYGTYGNDIFDATIRYDAIGSNRPVGYADESAPANLFSAGSGGEQLVSDFHVKDGSFIKLKNLSIGYSFPESVAERIRAERIRLYVAGQNLLILTKYTGADPEIGENALNNYLDMGIDRGYYPQPRSIIFGFQLGF